MILVDFIHMQLFCFYYSLKLLFFTRVLFVLKLKDALKIDCFRFCIIKSIFLQITVAVVCTSKEHSDFSMTFDFQYAWNFFGDFSLNINSVG